MQLRRAIVVALYVCFVARASTLFAETRPNLVLFLSDDHGQLDSQPYGSTDIRTPNMARLAADGMTFTRAFVASPACAPSRASLLTGLMPNHNGAMANHTRPRDDVRKWPAFLQAAGYEVAAFGKVAHYGQDNLYGFDHYDPKHDASVVAAWLDARTSNKPLCLIVGTHSPHVPWPEQTEYDPAGISIPATHVDTPETRLWRTRYYAAVTKADADLGNIRKLADERLGPNMLFLYTSDHGPQWPFGKWNLYDAGIRVPMLAAWPGVITPGRKTDAMVSWIDLLPTFVELAGGKPPESIDGQSFARVLRGESDEHRDRIFTTHSRDKEMNVYPIRSIRTGEWKYIRNLHPEARHTTHIDRGRPIDGNNYWNSWVERAKNDAEAASLVNRYHKRPAEELYDLRADPQEQHNLAGDRRHAEILGKLRAELDTWMKSQGDLGVVTEDEIARQQPPIKK